MKFASFSVAGRNTFGVALSADVIVDIKATAPHDCPDNLMELIRMGATGLTLVNEILQDEATAKTLATDSIEWLPRVRFDSF